MTIAVMTEVKSSNIESVGHDDVNETLFVKFASGGLYMYENVPEKIYEQFIESESKGKFFFTEIKSQYDYVKLENSGKKD